jgi:hypothetical protein
MAAGGNLAENVLLLSEPPGIDDHSSAADVHEINHRRRSALCGQNARYRREGARPFPRSAKRLRDSQSEQARVAQRLEALGGPAAVPIDGFGMLGEHVS